MKPLNHEIQDLTGEFSKNEGSILPLALIMTLTLLLGAVALGTVILEGVKRAKDTDASVGAYYLSDMGVERQLFEVRKNGRKLSELVALGGTLPDGSSWVSTGNLEPGTLKQIPRLETSSFAFLDLFDPDAIGVSPKIGRVKVTWNSDCPPLSPLMWKSYLEVSYAYWDLSGPAPQWPTTNQYTIQKTGGGGSTDIYLNEDRAYRLRLRALECPAKDIQVTTYGSDGITVKEYLGDITLSAEGTYKGATQKIAVTMPRQDVLSGLFGFVIFSECTLYKNDLPGPAC